MRTAAITAAELSDDVVRWEDRTGRVRWQPSLGKDANLTTNRLRECLEWGYNGAYWAGPVLYRSRRRAQRRAARERRRRDRRFRRTFKEAP